MRSTRSTRASADASASTREWKPTFSPTARSICRRTSALDAGCLFALDSDAHSIPEFPFTDYAIAHARIARIPADRVVNCWDKSRFDDWLHEQRVAKRSKLRSTLNTEVQRTRRRIEK